MKLNIFRVPGSDVEAMAEKLTSSGMSPLHEVTQEGWTGTLYYSFHPAQRLVAWAQPFKDYFGTTPLPENRNYFAAFVFTNGEECYVLSYGKAHFYLRPFCDHDFGIELAKRIADEEDTKQTASKRFQGRRTKDIKSFASNSRLDIESGESIDYIQSSTIPEYREAFGKSGKFGSSALLVREISPADLGAFLSKLDAIMSLDARFKLPRTTRITDDMEIAKYDDRLAAELKKPKGKTDFAHNSYDLYGVDFVFTTDGTFTITCPGYKGHDVESLSIADVKQYIKDNNLIDADILRIKIRYHPEDGNSYSKTVKESVDFIIDTERVILSNGHWMRFNQDYLEFLDDYVRSIPMEQVESQFADIPMAEGDFNASEEVAQAGYVSADKNFDIFVTRSSTPVEAWDLQRDKTVYAVKFASAQKLGYVCDQALAVLELMRNSAEVKSIPSFERYCLWLGYRAKKPVENIANSGSIILKQKIEAWARKCRDLGIEPVIKISRRVYPPKAEQDPTGG